MFDINIISKVQVIPRQAEVALGVPGRLRPRIFSTFGTTRVVGRQPNAPAAFTPGGIPGTHFRRPSQPLGTLFCRKEPWKKSQVTLPGNFFPPLVTFIQCFMLHSLYILFVWLYRQMCGDLTSPLVILLLRGCRFPCILPLSCLCSSVVFIDPGTVRLVAQRLNHYATAGPMI